METVTNILIKMCPLSTDGAILILVFLGTLGEATAFASAKVKNAIGRIGIFYYLPLLL